jgi:hypothetical protein
MTNFLPEGYDKIPSSGRYMKMQDGENTFRVLSPAVVGWEYWNTQNKPVRSRTRLDETPHDIRIDSDGKQSKVKHFWAFAVWNYDEARIQVLQIVQVQIQTAMKALVDSKHWGDPKNYDISVSRSGTGFETEYVVQGIPPKPLDAKIAKEYAKLKINLDALFTNEDPFGSTPKPTVPEDGEYQETTIEVEPPAPDVPARHKTVPPEYRPNQTP